jgi:small redox-active disulfide protein 2
MGSGAITQISLGKIKVGIVGLKEAIEEIRTSGARAETDTAQALLEKLKPMNYIPTAAQEEYKLAFLREYKRALGEPMTEEHFGLVIRILGPGCPNCHRLEQLVLEVLSELRLAADVELVKDVNEIAAHGVFGTPALLINDQIKVMGKVPSRDVLKQWFSGWQAQQS